MARTWTCRGCRSVWPRTCQKCPTPECGGVRPQRRRPKHQLVLEVPYEAWVEEFGERCGVCGRPPGPNRRLDRDHDHGSGRARGLLCHRHNRLLQSWVTVPELEKAIEYLRRADEAADGSTGAGELDPFR